MPYLAVTIRIPEPLAIQCRELAQKLGWQQADMVRALICVGGTFAFLTAKSPDRQQAAEKLLGGLKLPELSRSYSMNPWSRNYASRLPGRKSTFLSMSLPKSLCDLVGAYADLKEASRNEAYYKLLHQGLLAYLKAQTSLLET